MTRPALRFVHANSFPTGTYRIFLDEMRQHYDVSAMEMHAHDPQYPITVGWHKLADELIAEMTTHQKEPVILVGHSMGGALSLMAARARPDMVRAVILLDSPIVGGWRAWLVRHFRNSKLLDRVSPARLSEQRRFLWPSAAAAYEHFAGKEKFAAWAPGVLQDYIEHGMIAHEQGVALRFTREAETAIYRALPDHLGRLARKPFAMPIGFIGGTDSEECRQAGLDATRRLTGRHFRQIPGGHLFPMEAPEQGAAAVHAMIEDMLSA